MHAPSLLSLHARRAPARWDAAVRRVNRRFRLIWNPIIETWAVVSRGLSDQRLEFAGYGFPGWSYVASCLDAKGRPAPLSQAFLADLTDRTRIARQTTRHQMDLQLRQMWANEQKAKQEGYELDAEEAWQQAKEDIAKRLFGKTSSKPYAAPKPRAAPLVVPA